MSNQRDWTPGRLTIFTLLIVDVLALIVWAVANYDQYRTLTLVSTGLWTAALTVLGYFKVRSPAETTFAQFLSGPPVRAVVLVMTLVVAGGVLGMAPARVPLYRVTIRLDGTESARLVVTRDSVLWHDLQLDADSTELRLQAGRYQLAANASGFMPVVKEHVVHAYQLLGRQEVILEFNEVRGTLVLTPAPGATIVAEVYDSTNSVVRNSELSQPDSLQLPPGTYRVIGRADGRLPDSATVIVFSGRTVSHTVKTGAASAAPTHGTVVFEPDAAGAEIYVRGRGRIGVVPHRVSLPAGTYEVVIRQVHDELSPPGVDQLARTITVSAGGTVRIRESLTAQTMARLVIGASQQGGGSYVAIETATGIEHVLGAASGEVSAWLAPGRYRLIRRDGGSSVQGPSLTLASAQNVSRPGF